MSAIEFALMFDALAQMTPSKSMREACLALRDESIADIPAELEQSQRIFDMLTSDKPVTFKDGAFVVPIEYA